MDHALVGSSTHIARPYAVADARDHFSVHGISTVYINSARSDILFLLSLFLLPPLRRPHLHNGDFPFLDRWTQWKRRRAVGYPF